MSGGRLATPDHRKESHNLRMARDGETHGFIVYTNPAHIIGEFSVYENNKLPFG